MTPAARIQAAIEVLDRIIAAARDNGPPADRILAEWARTNRYAGSKDRRAVRELVYSSIRACGPIPATGRAAILRLAQGQSDILPLFDGSQYGPPSLEPEEQIADGGLAAGWLVDRLDASDIRGGEADILISRAPLDVRVNTLKADRLTIRLPISGEQLSAPQALRLPTGTRVEAWPAFQDGWIEIQDHGSQWACEVVHAQAGETVIDLCAGAGGKSLALAASMGNSGKLICCDTNRTRLSRLAPRAAKSGASVTETILLDPGKEMEALQPWKGNADRVLVDAPCSGSGTWRRNPEIRWRITPDALARLARMQQNLLSLGAQLVKPGGSLVFVTCSLFDEEGADQAKQFLQTHKGWQANLPDLPVGRKRGQGIRLTPFHDDTDGFFIARFVSSC